MLNLKRRMVGVVLKLFSAITAALMPVRVAARPIAVERTQPLVIRRRK